MFTGIVMALGRISHAQALGNSGAHGQRLEVSCPPDFLEDVHPGDSVALQGACMTVVTLDATKGAFTFDISAESLARTVGWEVGHPVNLEKALRVSDRLGGHLVSGHVDGLARVLSLDPVGESWRLALLASPEMGRYLAFKGSVAINGVSLTINSIADSADGCAMTINLIPHTVQHTTLGALQAGQSVNLEIDTVARYCERLLQTRN